MFFTVFRIPRPVKKQQKKDARMQVCKLDELDTRMREYISFKKYINLK